MEVIYLLNYLVLFEDDNKEIAMEKKKVFRTFEEAFNYATGYNKLKIKNRELIDFDIFALSLDHQYKEVDEASEVEETSFGNVFEILADKNDAVLKTINELIKKLSKED